ncbi:MAG: type IV pilus modification protein PilV [Gammaproteobacteria bacterium]|nr:MAG: type IV pilus modification protein PilV [Gammaproteobacteria bacterium]
MKHNKGFTLLEVLIAMAIFSFGLLAMAQMQVISIRNSTSAYQRSVASWMAYDMTERIRTNREIAYTGSYNCTMTEIIPAIPPDCEASLCSAEKLAQYDVNQWKNDQRYLKNLPDSKASIQVSGTAPYYTLQIDIQWQDNSSYGNDSKIQTFSYKTMI